MSEPLSCAWCRCLFRRGEQRWTPSRIDGLSANWVAHWDRDICAANIRLRRRTVSKRPSKWRRA